MKIFLDTAIVEEIKEGAATGLVDGVTTNPSLVMKAGKDYTEILREVTQLVDGDISAETISLDTEGMVREGREFAKLHKNIIVKVPLTPNGLKAVTQLKEEGIRCNVTLCFSATQALLAAKAGAYIVSPFVGRIDDISGDGMDLIGEIRQIYDNYGFETQILVASVRHALHVKQAALLGADIATLPYAVFQQIFKHPLTDNGIERFLKDWEEAKQHQK